jgi:hypothetical protein
MNRTRPLVIAVGLILGGIMREDEVLAVIETG